MNLSNLSEGSKSYHEEAWIYERFSQVEDTPGVILDYLSSKIKDKTVLDLGCGTGKYLVPLSHLAKNYVGLDISPNQLRIAQTKSKGLPNVEFRCSSAENIDLEDESIDTVISTWVFGTILDDNRRAKALSESYRVLKKEGNIYLVENDIGGDFEFIRGRYPNISRTQAYNTWLETQGFSPITRFQTYFEFDSLNEARHIFSSIWGQDASNRIADKKIWHNIIVFSKVIE